MEKNDKKEERTPLWLKVALILTLTPIFSYAAYLYLRLAIYGIITGQLW